ncbi:Gfo/Idh/MocA family oxidoreductase [Kineosporia sp. R_H_3]|uniref:Gfo/Idh/MocA family protein n=1 Tax=Kineosporia sp. R_H_3 TaxID=1961848 RepID=UPI0018E93327|nr:Gfo/Idh/MocA family oxidoreductase [Kineosporia sp. R_H_3]
MTDPGPTPLTDDTPGLRWGVLGTGGIARAFVTDLANLPTHSVVAVGSRTAAGAAAFGDRFAVPRRYDSVAGLVGDPDVDAVYVATPHPAHAEGALAAVAAGKHVLVEKAFTVDAAQAHAIADAAREAGVVVLEAMWTRFLPHTLRIRELIAAGAIGEVRTLVADHGQWFAQDPTHRLFDPDLGGGALLDLGIYPVSWASMILGAPSRVTAVSDPAFTGVDAQTSVILQYPGGAHAVLTTTLEALTPRRAWISGTEGTIEVDPTFYALTSFTLTRRDGHVERYETPAEIVGGRGDGGGKGLRFEAAELARCVAEGLTESPHLPVAETVAIMETMDEIRRQIGLVYPGEEPGGPAVVDGGEILTWQSGPDDVDPYEEVFVRLLRGLGLGHLLEAGCLTFVADGRRDEVLAAFGADLSSPMTVEEAGLAMVDAVCVLATRSGVVVAEANGYQGSRPEVLRQVGAAGRAASMFWNVNAVTRLTLVEDGATVGSEELIGLEEQPRPDLPADLLPALLEAVTGDTSAVPAGIEAAATWAGFDVLEAWFDEDTVVYPVLPVAEDFRPASPEHTTLAWSMADLVARVVAAPPATQRAIAEWAALDRLAAAGLDGDPAVAAVTSGFGTTAGGPLPTFEPVAALHETLRREAEVLRRTDPSRHGGETGPDLARAHVRLAALETLRHACWPVPVEAAIGALEGVLRGGADEHRALREVRLLLDRAG